MYCRFTVFKKKSKKIDDKIPVQMRDYIGFVGFRMWSEMYLRQIEKIGKNKTATLIWHSDRRKNVGKSNTNLESQFVRQKFKVIP